MNITFNKIRTNWLKLAVLPLILGISSCQLDYENTSAIDPSGAWGSETMIEAYLTNIYGGLMPGWNFGGDGSDETSDQNASMSDYQRGVNLSVSNMGINFDYEYIDRLNFLLEKLQDVPESVLSQEKNEQIEGQALFWRAWRYWSYVKNLGGVPLIMNSQDVNDMESLFVKRSSTSESIEAIINDLDKAAALLPERWEGDNYGKIDRNAVLAFKGRVLLWYASPLFNRDNDEGRWKDAYEANKDALDSSLKAGYKLMPEFNQIWLTDGVSNTEAIMFKRYKYPDSYYNMWTLLPEPLTNGYSTRCMPNLPAVLSFPQKDGSSMALFPKNSEFNPNSIDTLRLKTDPIYNEKIKETLISGMDPRFYASLSVPGLSFPSEEIPTGEMFWSAYTDVEGGYSSLLNEQFGVNFTTTYYGGFFPLKAVTPGTNKSSSTYGGVNPWIEIRLAEIYMNLAECAAELDTDGHDYGEALGYISELRDRAGIDKGAGKFGYGLDTYASKEGVRFLLINERLAEFSQENMRFGDLRRWMRFDIMNDEKFRSNIFFVYNESTSDFSDFDWTQNMANKATSDKFHLEFVYNVNNVEALSYNFTTEHWFYPIGLNTMSKNFINDKAQQNAEWGGTFDPLK